MTNRRKGGGEEASSAQKPDAEERLARVIATISDVVPLVEARLERVLTPGEYVTLARRLKALVDDALAAGCVELPGGPFGNGPTSLPIYPLDEGVVISPAEFPLWKGRMLKLQREAEQRKQGLAGSAERQPVTPPRRRRRCRVRIAGRKILLDDEPVPLDLTADRREVLLCYLGHLVRMQGDWISGPEIDADERRKPRGLVRERWDRVRKNLPESLQQLIETNRRKGYRLKGEAWRR